MRRLAAEVDAYALRAVPPILLCWAPTPRKVERIIYLRWAKFKSSCLVSHVWVRKAAWRKVYFVFVRLFSLRVAGISSPRLDGSGHL